MKDLKNYLLFTLVFTLAFVMATNTASAMQSAFKPIIPFERNAGQYDPSVAFCARLFCGTAFVTHDGRLVYSLRAEGHGGSGIALEERLVGARVSGVEGCQQSATRVNRFIGSNPAHWAKAAPTFDAVDMGEVYPGVTLRLRCSAGNVEKLFTVQPGVNPDVIGLEVHGGDRVGINERGELEVSTAHGRINFTSPVAYQEIAGERVYVDVEYTVDGHRYGFDVGDYDITRPLVIDPLLASTFLGGSGAEGGGGYASWFDIAVADNGDVLVVGMTASDDFPATVGSIEDEYGGGPSDLFVARLDAELTSIIACAYLGGAGDEHPYNKGIIKIASDGSIYLSGTTGSGDFPTTPGVYQPTLLGGSDVFITHLSADLSTLLASTYFGGYGSEYRGTVCLEAGGDVYVAGMTNHTTFPTTEGAYDRVYGGNDDFFVARLSGDLTSLVASTFVGGAYREDYVSLALDGSGNVYVAGGTGSEDYPRTTGAYDDVHGGSQGNDWDNLDCCVTKLNGDLTDVIASTFVGGDLYEAGLHLALDPSGNVFISGHTWDPDYPVTSGVLDEVFSGDEYFISKLSGDLSALLASTFNTPDDIGLSNVWSLTVDAEGNLGVVGATDADDIPVTPFAYDSDYNGGVDGYVQLIKSDLSGLTYCSYLGGTGNDGVAAVCLDSDENIHVIGFTTSEEFPVSPDAFDDYFGPGDGENDAFVARLRFDQFDRVTEGDVVNDGGHSWGVSWVDYDEDDYLDLFVTNLDIYNGLYHNNGDGSFTKITGEDLLVNSGGIGTAAASWADFNNDGYPDVFLATFREGAAPVNRAFYGNGVGTFTEATAGAIVSDPSMSIEPAWADYDNDGDLDLFVANHHDVMAGTDGSNFMYRQDDTGFVKITDQPTVLDSAGSNNGVWADYDNDGDQDLFVPNGWINANDCLYENLGDGTFSELLAGSPTESPGVSWGGSWGDYDNDGYLDLFVTQSVWQSPGTSYDSLYHNNGDGSFSAVIDAEPNLHGSYSTGSSWGDFDNDGDLDLFVAVDGQNLLYANNGDGSFSRVTAGVIVNDSYASVGCAAGDYDRDGDLDLFVTNVQQNNNLYRNLGNSNHWINIKCVGTVSNVSAVGARVRLKAVVGGSPLWQIREISSKTGKTGQNSLNAHFGLGDATMIDSIRVEWPSGIITVLTDIAADQFIAITESCCGRYTGGYTGNANCSDDGKLTLSDISRLIDRLYVSKQPLCCEANGNVNGSIDGEITLSDVSRLIDNIYISKQETAPCSQGDAT